MSILLDNIRCKHLLSDEKLQTVIKYAKNTSVFFSVPHHNFHIKDTIHYQALADNNYDMYNHLITTTNQYEHTEELFKKLTSEFSLDVMEPIEMTLDPITGLYVITDGVHRLSWMVFTGVVSNSIPIKYLSITLPETTINNFKNLLGGTTSSGSKHYNGWHNRTNFGYHSFDIFNFHVSGQRNPLKRLNIIKQHYSFDNKRVLDLGCNTGGMLLHLPEIRVGSGIDYDKNCIQVAKNISDTLKYNNTLEFNVMDLNNLTIETSWDVIFVLSIGSWVKDWDKLYTNCIKHAKTVILETNNDTEGRPQLDLFRKYNCNIKLISTESNDDITGNIGRKTYIIDTLN
jgi:hypothetical protein